MTTCRPTEGGEQPARRSRGRPRVPVDRIITAALRIVDEEGADALSMRSLAERLDSGTATLYRRFTDRANLIAQVVDRVFGEVELDAVALASASWDETCRMIACGMFDALSRHPNLAPLLLAQIPGGPHAMVQRERCLEILLDNGFSPDVAAYTYATLSRYVLGFAIQLPGPGAPAQRDDSGSSPDFRGLDPAEFRATVAAAGFLPVPLEKEFTFGLDLIIDGLRRLRRPG